jgi:hypothetical protein
MIQSEYTVGEKIQVTKKDLLGQKGSILYIGPLEGKEGIYCGVALEVIQLTNSLEPKW